MWVRANREKSEYMHTPQSGEKKKDWEAENEKKKKKIYIGSEWPKGPKKDMRCLIGEECVHMHFNFNILSQTAHI